MSRFLLPGGPAFLTFAGATIQMADDWTVNDSLEHFDILTNLQGRVARGIKDVSVKIRFRPVAFVSDLAATFAALYPWTPTDVGGVLFPATDVPAVIQTKDGKSITFKAAAITQMGPITCAPDQNPFGEFELTCIVAEDKVSSDADALFTVADSTYTEPDFETLDLLFDAYTLAYGASPSAPFDDILTSESGIVFTPGMTVEKRALQGKGTYNYRLIGVTADVTFTPENFDVEHWAAIVKRQGSGVKIGGLRDELGDVLTISGSEEGRMKITLPRCTGEEAPLQFSRSNPRVGAVRMVAGLKPASGGGFDPLFTLGTV